MNPSGRASLLYNPDPPRGKSTYERGTMMRKGPLIRLCSMRYVMRAMVWMVFPRPISSARMPFRLLLYRDTSHSKPLICKERGERSGLKPKSVREHSLHCRDSAQPGTRSAQPRTTCGHQEFKYFAFYQSTPWFLGLVLSNPS